MAISLVNTSIPEIVAYEDAVVLCPPPALLLLQACCRGYAAGAMPQGLCCRGYAPGAMLQEPWMMADEDDDDDGR